MKHNLLKCCFTITYLLTSTIQLIAQCPITVSSSPSSSTICSGNSVNLSATASSGSASYSWSPTTGLSNAAISNPVASPTTTTTYTVTALLQNGVEMVNNGSFESGNTGFSSNYTYVGTPSGTALWAEGTYAIGSNPNAYHSNFPTFADHTSGAGVNYMIVNGAAGVGTKVWCQTMAVTPGQTYQFSCWVATIIAASTAELSILNFDINGTNIGAFFSPSITQGAWTQYITSWTCPVGTSSITLCVENTNTTGSGNDFGIDDISFQTACIATSSLTVNVINPTATNNGPICSGQNVNLTANTIGGATYAWTGPSFTANTQNSSVTGITTSGTYTVNVTSGGTTCPATTYVTVNPLPTSSIAAISSICLGQSVNLAGTVSAAINVPVAVTNSTATAIPDAGITSGWTGTGSTYGTSNLAVTGLNTNWTLTSVVLNITHTWDSDVIAYLYDPCGNSIALINNNGSSSDNFTNTTFTPGAVTLIGAGAAPFTGTFVPAGGAAAWTAFITASQACGTANGTWSIHIGDYAGGDAGTLTNWTLNFNNPNSTSYVWSPTTNMTNSTTLTPTVTPTVAGTTVYTLTATNTYNCVSSANISVTAIALPVMTNANTATVCNGNTVSIPLTSSIASTYTWVATANANVGGESTTTQTTTTLSNTLTNTTGVNQTVIYTVTPTSITGLCLGTPQTITVTVTPTITSTFAAVAPICSGDVAPVLPTSSTNTPAITGTWAPAVSNTATATYTFTPTAGLCATTVTLTVTVNPLITPTFAAVASICSGATAPVLPTSSTNTPAITGAWAPVVSNTATATYTFTPTAGLCATTATLTVTVNPLITPTFAAVASICSGATAPVLPTSSTNTPAITGTWSPVVSNTATATYTFTPTAGLCATTATLTVTVNPLITPTFAAVAPICSGDVAPVLPTSSTNTPAITGTWSPVVSNTATGTYTFTPDAGQCAITENLTITVNPLITPTFAAVSDVCLNSTAPVLPTSSTNTPAITGTWSPVVSTATAGTATYTFTPTAGLCAVTTTLDIVTTSLIIPTFAAVAPICSGDAAPVLATSSTNTPAITGSWSPVVSNTVTGTYTFTPDANQCSGTTTLTITVNPLITPTFAAVAPICSGDVAPVLPTSSTNTPAITGTWSPVVSNTATTTYTFTPDAGICAINATLTITVNPLITPTFAAVAPICSGDVAPVLATSSTNTPAITGSWSPVVSNTATGTYTFTPDAGQCAITENLTITVNPLITPTFAAVSDVCLNSTAPVLPTSSTNTPAITGTWSPVVSTTTAGTATYTFTPTAGLCAVTTTLDIVTTSLIIPTFAAVAPICSGDAAPVLATSSTNTPAITGSWSPVVSNTATGTYTFTPDANQCSGTTTLTITVNSLPIVSAGIDQTICLGTSSITLTGSGADTYSWNNGVTNGIAFNPIVGSLNYTVIGTDANGCIGSDLVVVTVNANPTVNAGTDQVVCVGSVVTLTGSGTLNYLWNNGIMDGIPFTPVAGVQTYTVTGTDINGCINSDQVVVTVNTLPIVNAGNDQVACFGTVITLTATGSTTYSWDNSVVNGIAFTPPVGTNTYTVTGTVGTGCFNTDQVTVVINPTPVINAGLDQSVCDGSTVILTATGGLTYSWDNGITNGIGFIPVNGMTTYSVIGTDVKGCISSDQVVVTSNTIPSAPVVSPVVYCVNDFALPLTALDAVQGSGIGIYSFNWYTSNAPGAIASSIAPTPSTLVAGPTNYYVSETNIATGCQGAMSTIPVLINALTTSTFNSINAVCEGSISPILPVNSSNTPAFTGTWNPSTINTTIPGTSTYTFIPTAGQCASTQTMDITINPLPVLIITTPADVCFPETVDLTNTSITLGSTGTDLLTYWSSLTPLTTLNTPTQITTSGTYFIQSTSLAGCSSVTSVNVLIHSIPIASFTPSPSIVPSYYTESTMLNNSINATDYIWDFGDQTANSTLFSPTHEFPYDVYGNYTVKLTAISQFGCIDIAYETVTIKEELVYYVPNTFTPDDNDLNDEFLPVFTSGYDPSDYSLLIFNRWGEIVFESHDAKIGWNGKMGVDGNTVQIGTYTWKIEFKAKLSSQKQIVVGHVNVVK